MQMKEKFFVFLAVAVIAAGGVYAGLKYRSANAHQNNSAETGANQGAAGLSGQPQAQSQGQSKKPAGTAGGTAQTEQSCPVKGYATPKGDKLFYVATDAAYARIKATECFTSIADAQAAGYTGAAAAKSAAAGKPSKKAKSPAASNKG